VRPRGTKYASRWQHRIERLVRKDMDYCLQNSGTCNCLQTLRLKVNCQNCYEVNLRLGSQSAAYMKKSYN
jgi:hypothetical protein